MASSFKSINDQLLEDCKSLPGQSGALPFPSWGAGWGAAQIYRSEAHWDAYIDQIFGMGSTRSVEHYMQQVGDPGDNSLYMAAIRFLGDSFPEAPLQVKKKTDVDGDGQKGESVVVPDHALAKLWRRPNDAYPGITLKKGIAYSLVTNNNAYVIKFFNNVGFPLELWWEPHWTIRPVWPIDGSSFIAYYEVNRGGIWYPIPVQQVIHIRDGINPYNQRLGLDGNRSIAREIAGDQSASEYYANLMGGSGVPGFAVSIDKERQMDEATMERFDRRVQEKTRGSKKGQPLILHGARPYKLGLNPKEMDLRETRYMAEDRFCGVKGIPAVVLELGSGMAHSIYKNVSEAQKRAWLNYVCPKLTLIEETLDIQLLEDFEGKDSGLYCRHDLTQVEALQEGTDAKEKRLTSMYGAGGIMRLEYRSGMGYGPSDPKNPDADRVWSKLSAQENADREEKRAANDLERTRILANSRGRQFALGGIEGERVPPRGNVKKQPIRAVKSVNSNGQITWVDFPVWLGSLNIPRTHMPQVLSSHRGAMVQFLKGRGISNVKEEVLPHSLRPSQKEYSPEKVAKAKEWTGPQRPLLVSEDNFVADGHHQWAAALDNPESPIPIFRLGTTIIELLLEIARFPSSGVKDENDVEIFWNGTSKKAIPGMRAEFENILPNCEVALDEMDMLLALLATDRILTFASEFPEPASLLKKVEMLPAKNPDNLAYIQGLEEGGYRMVFNSDLWSDQETMKRALVKTIGTDDISTVPVDTIESTIDHELAHVLDGWVRLNKNGDTNVGSDNPVWASQDALNMSRYSIAGPAESFAEGFAIRQLFGIEKVPAGEIRQSLQDTLNFASQSV